MHIYHTCCVYIPMRGVYITPRPVVYLSRCLYITPRALYIIYISPFRVFHAAYIPFRSGVRGRGHWYISLFAFPCSIYILGGVVYQALIRYISHLFSVGRFLRYIRSGLHITPLDPRGAGHRSDRASGIAPLPEKATWLSPFIGQAPVQHTTTAPSAPVGRLHSPISTHQHRNHRPDRPQPPAIPPDHQTITSTAPDLTTDRTPPHSHSAAPWASLSIPSTYPLATVWRPSGNRSTPLSGPISSPLSPPISCWISSRLSAIPQNTA